MASLVTIILWWRWDRHHCDEDYFDANDQEEDGDGDDDLAEMTVKSPIINSIGNKNEYRAKRYLDENLILLQVRSQRNSDGGW